MTDLLAAGQIAPGPGASQADCFILSHPLTEAVPLVLSSPHSGRRYPHDFIASTRLGPTALRRSEDSFVDDIFASAPAQGASLLAATFPRAFCDANREAWELDPAMFEDPLPSWVNTTSPRVMAGLGTIARVVSDGRPIYAAKLRFAEAERRVRGYWQPYHDALSALVDRARGQFGACVLMDCHSMPAHACEGRRPPPDIVLGDAYGTACAPAFIGDVERMLAGRGYTVRRNDPYAGGFVTRHYGKPARGVHALQIEIARGLYMNEETLEKTAGFARIARDMQDLIGFAGAASLGLARD